MTTTPSFKDQVVGSLSFQRLKSGSLTMLFSCHLFLYEDRDICILPTDSRIVKRIVRKLRIRKLGEEF